MPPLRGLRDRVYGLGYLADGKEIAVLTDILQVWNADTATVSWTSPLPIGYAPCISISPDGQSLAVAGEQGVIALYSLPVPGRPTILQGHHGIVESVAFSPDGKTILSGGRDGSVRLWNVACPPRSKPFAELPEGAGTVLFSPNGTALASVSWYERVVRLWRFPSGELDGRFSCEGPPTVRPTISADGRTLAMPVEDQLVRTWDTQTGAVQNHPGWHHIAFAPQGTTAGVAARDHIQLFDYATGSRIAEMPGIVRRAAVSFLPGCAFPCWSR
jgi:WD40 repeat protein